MRISPTPAWPGAPKPMSPAPRFRSDEPKPDEFVPVNKEAEEDDEPPEDKTMENGLLRFSAALIIAATALLLYSRYDRSKPDLAVPPKIHATETPAQPKVP